MRLVSFELPSIMGPQLRTGALDPDGLIVDLQAAHRLSLIDEGLSPEAAARLARALLPGDMVELIEGGARSLDAAREALDWAATHPAWLNDVIVNGARLRAPIPRPPMLRDFMGFEQHLLNIFPKLGREIPPEWYKLPVYYKGNPGSIATHGDDIPIPSYGGEVLDIEFELAFVIGRGGRNIPASRARDNIFGDNI
jgi:2-keto-4-pentenoate hydratase/2-oxohepta-3-ene-1,7-dioic acid hydratase in catechol pathway